MVLDLIRNENKNSFWKRTSSLIEFCDQKICFFIKIDKYLFKETFKQIHDAINVLGFKFRVERRVEGLRGFSFLGVKIMGFEA